MKKFFRTLAVLTTLTALTVPQSFAFPDITANSDLANHVEYLVQKGIIAGYPDGNFKPEQTINRAEALKIIFKMFDGEPYYLADPKTDVSVFFPDVKADDWFAPHVATAKVAGVISGYPDGTFHPNQEVNRAEFVKMAIGSLPFASHLTFDISAAVQQFSDVDSGQWYIPYLSAALELKFLPETKQFKPTAWMRRQDAVEIIYRISKYLDEHPLATEEDTEIPYVPEEAFVEIDPTVYRNQPEEFGPDKLYVRKDIGKTDITNFYAGYSLTINEIVHVENFERSADRMTLTYDRGCAVDIMKESTGGQNPEGVFQELNKDSGFMNIPDNKWIERLTDLKNVEAYRMNLKWDYNGKHHEDVMVFTPAIYYLINPFSIGAASEEECDKLAKTIASQFSLLQP